MFVIVIKVNSDINVPFKGKRDVSYSINLQLLSGFESICASLGRSRAFDFTFTWYIEYNDINLNNAVCQKKGIRI